MTFTAFQPPALVCWFLYCSWNVCISSMLCKEAKSNTGVSIKNLTDFMAVTEVGNYQIFQLKNLLSWLPFQCLYQLVHVLNQVMIKRVTNRQSSSLEGDESILSSHRACFLKEPQRRNLRAFFALLPFSIPLKFSGKQVWSEKQDFWFLNVKWAENREASPIVEITTEVTFAKEK